MKNNVTVIMYHYIRDLQNSRFPEIKGLDVQLFNEQIKYLLKHYHIISIDTLIDSIENNHSLPSKSVLLSFDDGYSDHFDYVLPVLTKYKIQGCFYPPAKAILHSEVLDVNKIHFILATVTNKHVLVNEIFDKINEYRNEYQLNSPAEYFAKHAVASRYDTAEVMFIKYMLQVVLKEELRLIICNYLFNKYVTQDTASFSQELYMSIEQVKNLKDQGMHVGSHGYNHYWLASLSKNEQEAEIDRSLDFLQLVGCDTDQWTMCYPYGNYNTDTLAILNDKKCKLALTTKIGIADLNEHRRFELPRLDTNDIPTNAAATTNDWFHKA